MLFAIRFNAFLLPGHIVTGHWTLVHPRGFEVGRFLLDQRRVLRVGPALPMDVHIKILMVGILIYQIVHILLVVIGRLLIGLCVRDLDPKLTPESS